MNSTKTIVTMDVEDFVIGLTRWDEADKKTELLRYYDLLSENIQDVPCDMFAELENTFGNYAYGSAYTDEELDAKHYGHTWRELIRLVCEENTRRRVYGIDMPYSYHEEGAQYTKMSFARLKKLVVDPNVEIQIVKPETAPED